MSLPFAINSRLAKGDDFWKLQSHIIWRTVGLLVMGVFMVNAESGYNEEATGMSIAVWSLMFYLCAILVWNVYRFKNKIWGYLLQVAGAIGLLLLAWTYRGGEGGSEGMKPRWWGILGLIGWAYLFSCIIYQLFKGKVLGLILAIACMYCLVFGQPVRDGKRFDCIGMDVVNGWSCSTYQYSALRNSAIVVIL